MIDELGFGQRFERAMIKSGYNNARLTKELGLSKNTIGNYKNNQIPNTTTLYEISQKLGTSIDYLLTGNEKSEDLKEKEKRMLTYFRNLPDDVQSEELGRLGHIAEQYCPKSKGKSSESKIG